MEATTYPPIARLGTSQSTSQRKTAVSDGSESGGSGADRAPAQLELLLAATPQGLTRAAFEGHGDFDALRARATSRRGSQAARRHLTDAAAKLRDYFAGNTDRVQWVVDWAFLESSGALALRSTESIPYAGHRSYTDLANAGSARDLGWIMGANPIPIVAPCHRVTRGVEVPTTFVGGSERRHWLERHETTARDAPPH